MDLDNLSTLVVVARRSAAAIAFLAGLAFSINPVAIAAIPVSLAYVTRARAPAQAVEFGTAFVLGMIATHAALGAIAGATGAGLEQLIGRHWALFLGPLMIVLGLVWLGWIPLRLPALTLRGRRAGTRWSAFLLGAPFSIAICPVCTPALVVLLGVAAGSGSITTGILLLVAFALGRAIPIVLGAVALAGLERLSSMDRYRRWLDLGGGVLLIGAGIYLLNAYYFWIPSLAR